MIVGNKLSSQAIVLGQSIICEGDTFSIYLNSLVPSSSNFQWQKSNGGAVWSDINNGITYLGANNDTLQVFNVSSFIDNYLYRLLIDTNANSSKGYYDASNNSGSSGTFYKNSDGNLEGSLYSKGESRDLVFIPN